MQSELAPQEVAKRRLTVLGRFDFLCCFSCGSLLFRDLAVVQVRRRINILLCIFTSPGKLVLRRDLHMHNKDITLVPWLYQTRFLPGTTRPSWLVFAKDCLPGICIILYDDTIHCKQPFPKTSHYGRLAQGPSPKTLP
jgi:hypothetical protein